MEDICSLPKTYLLFIMKLHLPKLLCAALIAALAIIGTSKVQAVEVVENVGCVDTSKTDAAHTIIDASTKDVTVGKGQAAGAFITDDEGNAKLITSFGSYKYDTYTKELTTTGTISNHLKVEGKLTINDDGQVYLGGQVRIVRNGSGVRDSYSGLIADSVEINGDGSVTNLNVGTATIGTLTINSGSANIHTTGTPSGSSSSAPNVGTDCKIAKINKALNVNGGTLSMGYASKASSGTSHYQTYFAKGASINQTGGTIKIAAQAFLAEGVTINQSGGSFSTPETAYGQMEFALSKGTYNLNQTNSEQGGSSPTFEVKRLASAISTSLFNKFSPDAFNISQTADNGTISLTTGTSVTGNKKFTLSSTSSLNQNTVNGKINFGGDFSGASYNIDQKGSGTINILSGCTFNAASVDLISTAKLNVSGNLTINGDMAFTALSDDSAAIVMGTSGNLSMSEAEVSLSISLAEASMYNSMVTAAIENEEGIFTIDLISGLSGTDAAELQALIDNGALTLGENVELLTTSSALALAADTEETRVYTGFNITSVTGTALQVVDGKLQAVVSVSVPEPTTATLSLMALAALAARRRRK